jgi:hypothetical protein
MKPMETRRTFLKTTAVAAAGLAGLGPERLLAGQSRVASSAVLPWFRTTYRWGQTNITEIDPQRYDIAWWRDYWKRTRVQGVIVNAGGIVAYYPSTVEFHRPAQFLGGRDLFGDLCRAAHEDGLAVFARMDSNRAHAELYTAHPDWFALDAEGKPYRAGDLFVTCVNGPYYERQIPAILGEIISRYRPEGFTDNSWSGLGRESICYCENCRNRFRKRTGLEIPREKDWHNAAYRKWIDWNYARRVELWDLNNRVTRAAGGPDCIWAGMNSGSIRGQCQSFRDYREICHRAEIIMLDHQSRSDPGGFQQNAETGLLVHGLLGWDKLAPESMAMYQAGKPTFRLASKPEAEARLWMLEGIAGGIQPWWHHIAAYHEDRRMYQTAGPVFRWHADHQHYLVNRRPIATVGVVWSQRNTDFFGRDDAETLVELPWRGITQALVRARIPYLPVHADDIQREAAHFSVLVLPNLAAMSGGQIDAVRRFVDQGGALVATGQTSLCDEWGDPREDFALADLFGAHRSDRNQGEDEATRRKWATDTCHSYLRLAPELRARTDGPHLDDEPRSFSPRHPVLRGFDQTDILPFGGMLSPLNLDPGVLVPATFVPPFPIYPPETAWMREPKTSTPGLVLNTSKQGSRIAFLPADLDRRFARDNLPDHGDLLGNLVRWAAKDNAPLLVEGPGLIDCHLYRQERRLILHLVNLTSAGAWRQPVHELIPVGPLLVRIKLPADVRGRGGRLLVAGRKFSSTVVNGWSRFEIASIRDHEVAVLT